MKTTNPFFQNPPAKQPKLLNSFVFAVVVVSILLLLLIGAEANAQNVGINSTGNTPNTSALLDLDASPGNNKGLLIPRILFAERTGVNFNPLSQAAQGLVVYQVDAGGAGEGFYYNISTNTTPNWVKLSSVGTAWSLTGNASTVDGTNFLGTTDDIPLTFRVNNQQAGRIDRLNRATFLGYQAGNSDITSPNENTAIGYWAFYTNTTGFYNVANGTEALYSNTDGYCNTAIGHRSLYSNAIGYHNTAIGYNALKPNTGNENTAIGSQALWKNIGGGYNTATGVNALTNNTTGNYNTANGEQALGSNVAGSNGVAIGYSSQYNVNSSAGAWTNTNTSIGYQSLMGSTPASDNTGLHNTAVGYQSLLSNTTGNWNTATGRGALTTNTIGYDNTAVGLNALTNNLGGYRNTALGSVALNNNISGNWNTALGYSAGFLCTGSSNVFIGYRAGDNLTSGSTNILIGNDIDAQSITGNNQLSLGNLIFGSGGFGTGTTVGTGKISIGTPTAARRLTITGDQQTSGFGRFMGWNVEALGTGGLAAEIGANGTAAVMQSYNRGAATFGDIILATGASPMGITIKAATGNVGIGCAAPAYKLHVIGDIASSTAVRCPLAFVTGAIAACSDIRYKKNINPLPNALSNVMKLQGVNYYWKTEEFPEKNFTNEKQIGFIAQEIEKIYPQVVITDMDGYKSVDYSRITPVLVEAIKEQQQIINNLQSKIEKLETSYGNRIKRLEELTEIKAGK